MKLLAEILVGVAADAFVRIVEREDAGVVDLHLKQVAVALPEVKFDNNGKPSEVGIFECCKQIFHSDYLHHPRVNAGKMGEEREHLLHRRAGCCETHHIHDPGHVRDACFLRQLGVILGLDADPFGVFERGDDKAGSARQ